MKRQLDTLITGARSIGAKFIIGSAGTAGGDRNLQAVRELVEQIAAENSTCTSGWLCSTRRWTELAQEEAGRNKIVPSGRFPS